MELKRTMRLKSTPCAAMVLLVVLMFIPIQAAQGFTTPPIPFVEGPITGPDPMWSGLVGTPSTTTPLADYGYIAEEYFVSGTANGQPYKTRILVRRPEVPEKFSGIVVAEIMHSNGTSVTFGPARVSIMLRGHIHLEIAAQKGNVDNTLKSYNPARYGSLSIPSSSQLSEIVAQVGTLIKSDQPPSPLYPLYARHLLLQGTSNASQALRTYQSNAHFQFRLEDGNPIMDGYLATSTLGNSSMMVVDVPTIQMPTQTEVTSQAAATGGIKYRRPDSDDPANRFRIYEVAGMPHANSRDTVTYVPNPCQLPISDFTWGAMAAMGLNHLVEWVDNDTIPPHAQYIAVDYDTSNDGSLLVLDEYGNAEGGVRNTYVDVPVAKYGVPNSGTGSSAFTCSIAGYRLVLPEDTLESLYKNRGQYISEVNQRLMEFVREGWFLPEYADLIRSDAQDVSKTLIKPKK